MSQSAKKITTLDSLVQDDHVNDLKGLIVASTKAYPAEELFELRFGETRIGPLWNQDLKAFVAQDPNFPVSCLVSQFAAEDWIPLLQHPFFQRRKPQLVARNDLNIETEQFHVLREGKKTGPYNAQQMQEKLQKGEVYISDQVSTDGGHSWGRLYEIEDFDRRNIVASGSLPFMPEWQVFNNSFDEVENNLGTIAHNTKAMATDAIASLAYLENLQSGKAGKARTVPDAPAEAADFVIPKTLLMVVAALAVGLGLAAWYTSTLTEPTRTPAVSETPAAQIKRAAPMAKPVAPNRLGQEPATKRTFSEGVINSVQPAKKASSFRKSRAFKNNVNQNQSDFDYNNDRPLEQDAIGSKLSRETINPDDSYQQELAEEGINDAEVDYESDRFGTDTKRAEEDFAKLYETDNSVGEGENSDQINDLETEVDANAY